MEGVGAGHHLQLIDGSGFIFRAFHALPPLTRKSDKLPIGAVSGFCAMLFRYLEQWQAADAPTHLAVVFDHKGPTFRSGIFPEYKMNRPPMPEDLVPQMPLTREATMAFNIVSLEMQGYEADDIIATLAVRARVAGARVTIVSSDKDLMQIVGDGVEMLDAMNDRRIGPEEVFAKFGVGPGQVIDVQSLAGDSVDNIPGAPGIGVKIAAQLINEYGDLDTLLERAAEIKQPKRRQTLLEKADQIRVSRELVTLKTDVPIETGFGEMELKEPDAGQLLGFLARMEFRTLSRRVAARLGVEAPTIADPASTSGGPEGTDSDSSSARIRNLPFDSEKYETVRTMAELESWIERIRRRGRVAIDTETTGLDEMQVDLVGVCLSVEPGQAAYVPLAHTSGVDDLFGDAELVAGQLPLREALAVLKPVLEDRSILKIGHNIKFDSKILAQPRYGILMDPIDDTMLISYALHGGLHNHGMDLLSERYLDHRPTPIKSLIGSGRKQLTFNQVDIKKATAYAAEDADITLRLWSEFKPRLHSAGVSTVYETLERPLVPVLRDLERTGIRVDRDQLAHLSNSFAADMAALQSEIHGLAGVEFNVGSPKQLGEILFDRLGLPGGRQGKSGAYSTGQDVLEDLASEGHELPSRVLDWRQVAKLKSTYTDALQDHINPETGRVHTSYSIAGANTGRLASTDPNLQNIPVRTEAGRKIREAFVPKDGHVLLSVDYSQIELRILAHIAGIESLKQAFRDGHDIHAMTASEIFGVPVENMDPMIRRQAKAINFGVIYGISGFGLARNLRIPRKEAQAFINTYFERFPQIREYMDSTVASAKKNLYVETLFGRRIHTPEIVSAKGPHAGFARRAAINAPIQGTAADVIRRAMIRMPAAIRDLPASMLLQVHDELLFEVLESAVDETLAVVSNVMEEATLPVIKLDVPLTVDGGIGGSWAEAH